MINWAKKKWEEFKLKQQMKKLSKNEPLDIERKWLEEAKPKILKPSIAACTAMLSSKGMSMAISYHDLNLNKEMNVKVPVEFLKDEMPGLAFAVTSSSPLPAKGVYYKESFGLNQPLEFSIKANCILYSSENSVINFRNNFPAKPNKLQGRLKNIGTKRYSDIQNVYIRQIVKLDDTNISYPATIIKEKAFLKFDDPSWNRKPTLLGIRAMTKKEQYCEVTFNNERYDFYTVESMQTQIIDSNQPESLASFKEKANAIRSAFAILSGKYYRTNVFYVTSKKEDFSEIVDVYYEMEEPSWHGEFQLIDLSMFSKLYEEQTEDTKKKLKKYHELFPVDVFNKLCQEICNNDKIARVVDLTLSGNANLNAIQQGAIYSVAIETFANDIYENNEAKLNPVPDKQVFKPIREDLLKIVNDAKDKIGDTATGIFRNKINELNRSTNRDRLFKPFELYGIELTNDEVSSLDNRNDFLHGRVPHEDEWKIKKVALDLHFLLCCLLLKYVGYSGYINNPAVHYVAKNITEGGDYLPTFDPAKLTSMENIQKLESEGRNQEAKDAIDNNRNAIKAFQMLKEATENFIKII